MQINTALSMRIYVLRLFDIFQTGLFARQSAGQTLERNGGKILTAFLRTVHLKYQLQIIAVKMISIRKNCCTNLTG